MQSFASLDELKDRLDWTLTEDEDRALTGALEDLSDMARYYGLAWDDPAIAPRMVRTVVLSAAVRYAKNLEGLVQSRAGDETLVWSDLRGDMGYASFNDREQKVLASLGGQSGIVSVPIYAWGNTPQQDVGYVPVDYVGGKPFPMFTNDNGPW